MPRFPGKDIPPLLHEPDISVVVPTFRRTVLLKRCVAALLTQTADRFRYEVIVVTDGPDEETTTMLTMLMKTLRPGFLRCYSLPQKGGPAAARNLGWKMANGAAIVFTDDDCLPDAALVENYRTAFRNSSGHVFTGRVIVPLKPVPTDYEKNISRLETAAFITANCGIPKRLLEKVGGFDERFPMAWREDSELHFKLLSRNIPVKKLPGAIVCHPVRQAGWGISLKEEKKNRINALLFRKYPALYRKHISAGPAWNYYLWLLCLSAGIVLLLKGEKTAGISLTGIWLAGTLLFVKKRLQGTSKKPLHVLDMLATSALIPFFSAYWSLYGAIKYRVFFLN